METLDGSLEAILTAAWRDVLALVWFLACWSIYAFYADRQNRSTRTLVSATHDYRLLWMKRLIRREVRIMDAALLNTLMRSVGLFLTTTLLILGALVAMLGNFGRVQTVTAKLPFADIVSHTLDEAKIGVLIVIFVYAFFKFAWALRQYNFALVMIGAAPMPDEGTEASRDDYAARAATLETRAVYSFNNGLRAYYFGLGTLSWFLHPFAFMAAAVWVVAVLYRREFNSHTLKAMAPPDEA